ncbi:MAG: MmcQ/YjbR family DNA-binding protein [Nannocystaceae bacterium]|nr:MmcQ/YjbR family DNA-binding protein [Nannocystaceae bacterium]
MTQRSASIQRAAPTTREHVLAKLRAICLAQPGALEKLSHGEPTWFRGPKGKVFAMFDDHHHGAPHISVWLAATMDQQEALVAAEPARYFRPPYVGHRGWVAAVLDDSPDWRAVEALVREAFALVAPTRASRGASSSAASSRAARPSSQASARTTPPRRTKSATRPR